MLIVAQTISNHEALASMMAMPIMVVASVKSVNTSKANGRRPIRERTIIYEGSSGPRELLEAIVIQAQAASKGLEGTQEAEPSPDEMTEEQKRRSSAGTVDKKGKAKQADGPTDENKKLLDFCQRILATAAAIDRSLKETKGEQFLSRLKASLPNVPTTASQVSASERIPVEAGENEEETKKIYIDWATRTRFEYCDMTIERREPKEGEEVDYTPNYKFYFNNEARMLAHSDIPKRSLAIAKEVSVLRYRSQSPY